ncbi:MAG: cupredoxin domain-containing protein [Polyangiaceae bacterium]|nr:cupredoxin domain-containing protein [Polyangiaceae bacterium]MBK8940457.1 cupredoxin domain-containing protein [Polyangiaceae bacterium]
MRKLLAALVFPIASSCSDASQKAPPIPPGATEVKISVDDKGYTPSEARAPAGEPVRLVFTRTTDEGCGQQLVFPDQKIRKDLPLKEPVTVDITMPASGKVTFSCGMDMYRGAIVVE